MRVRRFGREDGMVWKTAKVEESGMLPNRWIFLLNGIVEDLRFHGIGD